MKFIAIGYPDEENAYHGHHTTREEWYFEAPSKEAAVRMAREHFYYFHEVGVWKET